VNAEEHVERLIPMRDAMMSEGLVTVAKVRVLEYAPGTRTAAGA